jgi:hypothetical protein
MVPGFTVETAVPDEVTLMVVVVEGAAQACPWFPRIRSIKARKRKDDTRDFQVITD